jgi:hypothetical protein
MTIEEAGAAVSTSTAIASSGDAAPILQRIERSLMTMNL